MPELKIPLVYCGNSRLVPFLKEALNETFDLHFTDNVRPDRESLNLEPAKNTVHNLFKEKVMQRAPGFPKLAERTTGIVPTPTAVEKILRLYAKKNRENIVVVDMGGSTTDIYTNIKGGFKRTVAANVGLSYSMANILESIIRRGGIGELLEYLPKSYDENSIRNYFYNKTLQPSYLPQTNSEYLLEQACAILGFQFSWQQHIQMNFCRNYEDYFDHQSDQLTEMIHGFWNLLKKGTTGKSYTEKLFYPEDCKSFALAEIDTIIGSGGVIAYAKSKEDQIMMLADGFLPYGITKLAIDKPFKISHMGILSDYQPDLAVELFENSCLQDLAWLIAPYGDISAKHTVLEIYFNEKKFLLKGGECCYFPNGGSFVLKTGLGIFLKHKTHHFSLTTDLPVLFDCRGRDRYFIHKSLINCNIPEFSKKDELFQSAIPLHQTVIKPFSEQIIKRELPYEGQIIVNHRQSVSASTVIGVNQHFPARHFFIDIRTILGLNKKISREDLQANIAIRKGQIIKPGELIWHKDFAKKQIKQIELESESGNDAFRTEGSGTKSLCSPYYAEVCNILSNGLVVLKEIRNYYFQPEIINIGLHLDLPAYIAAEYCKLKVGDFVEQNALIASCMQKRVVSTKCGFVKEINRSKGTITIHYDKTPLPTHAFINGHISLINDGCAAEIKSRMTDLKGLIGFGGENFGTLSHYNPVNLPEFYRDKITYHSNPVKTEDLIKARQNGWKGIIAPSMHSTDWLNFYGKELGVAITGNEDIPFTLILLHGFGKSVTIQQVDDFFKTHNGKTVSLTGQTQIRAGVIRPQIRIS